jgi:Ca-activated chloride channel family protein
MEIADKVVTDLLDHLEPDDRFGLVTFSDYAVLVDPLTSVGDKRLERLKGHILDIQATSSTNMEAGMELATRLLTRYLEVNQSEYENRIIFLTDAQPNTGQTGKGSLAGILNENSDNKIYTTFIGIGVDFNTELVDFISKTKGANYYSVHSAGEFRERLDDEFNYMVTPLVFDLQLKLDAPGYKIEKVYGSPEADEATGRIMYVNTLFPSKAEEGKVKGGVVLIKLSKLSTQGIFKLNVSYKDREDRPDSDETILNLDEAAQNNEVEFFQDSGIRKAVLLTRYADLLKDWIMDERKGIDSGQTIMPVVTFESGIVVPAILGEWERQSVPLVVSDPYKKLFGIFGTYFQGEMKSIGDGTLQQELTVLDKLSKHDGTDQNGDGHSSPESRNRDGGFWGWLSGQR